VGEQERQESLVERLHYHVQLTAIARQSARGFAASNADTTDAVSRICQ
jgi:hypothetical protein